MDTMSGRESIHCERNRNSPSVCGFQPSEQICTQISVYFVGLLLLSTSGWDPGWGLDPFHLYIPAPSPESGGVGAEKFAEWPILMLMSAFAREALGSLHHG